MGMGILGVGVEGDDIEKVKVKEKGEDGGIEEEKKIEDNF